MRASVASITKKFLSTFFAATLILGLVPAAAFAVDDDNGAPAPENTESADADRIDMAPDESGAYETFVEPLPDESVPTTEESQDESVGASFMWRDEEAQTEDNASTGEDSNLSIPAATERINEDVMLTTPVAQQETTKNYFLAQTLESTRTVPIVSANLPLDRGPIDVEVVVEPDAEGEGSSSEDEGGESSDDPDDADDLVTTDDSASGVISTEASDSERSGEISTLVAAASTVVGSFTYRGITYAVEPGGETVAIVAADYTKLPEDFIEAKAIVLPSMVTPDGIDYYSVTRIADYAFSSLNTRVISTEASASERSGEISSQESEDSNAESESAYIDAITVPATVTEIGDNAYTDFNTLQYILVSDDNQQYSQYDGCLYDKPQSRLLLIPEGRLGAVRVAPSVTEVSPEAFSHCPSVDTLVADPDSAAYQLLEGMSDIDKVLKNEMDVNSHGFAFADLGSVENGDDVLMSARPYFADNGRSVLVSHLDNMAGEPEVLIRNDASFVIASVRDVYDLIPDEANVTTSVQERTVQNADAFGNARNGGPWTSFDMLPSWIQRALTNNQPTRNDIFLNKELIKEVKLYGASDQTTTTNNLVAGVTHLCVPHKDRYSIAMHSGTVNATSLGQTLNTNGAYDSLSDMAYQGNANNANLGWNSTFGFCGRDSNMNRPLLRSALPSASTGEAIVCRYALLVTYKEAAKMYSFSNRNVNHVVLLPAECKVTWEDGVSPTASTISNMPTTRYIAQNGTLGALPANPTRSNAVFMGWYTDKACIGSQVTADTIIADDTVLYAKWSEKTWTININPNGGTILDNSNNRANLGSSILSFQAEAGSGLTTVFGPSGYYCINFYKPGDYAIWKQTQYLVTRTGYTQDGWTSSSGAYVNSTTGDKRINPSATNETFTASWKANTYTVTIKTNGGKFYNTEDDMSRTVAYGSSDNCSLVFSYHTKTGHELTGAWNQASGGTKIYEASGMAVPNTAYWDANRKWKGTSNLILYCQWNPIKYKVAYNANGGTGTAMASTEHTYGAAKALSLCTYTKSGYKFDGWATSENGSVAYRDGQEVTNLSAKSGDIVNLYAKWSLAGWTVTINAAGGGVWEKNSKGDDIYLGAKYTYDSEPGREYTRFFGPSGSYVINTFRQGAYATGNMVQLYVKRPGYTQVHWHCPGVGYLHEGSDPSSVLQPDAPGRVFSAGWRANTYNVSVYCPVKTTHAIHHYSGNEFQSAEGQSSTDGYAFKTTDYNCFTVYGSQPTTQYIRLHKETDPVLADYHLNYVSTEVGKYVEGSLYWDDKLTDLVPGGPGTKYYQDAKLYLGWGYTDYTVTYDANGGDGSHANATGLRIDGNLALPSKDGSGMTKRGYTLTGWKAGSKTFALGSTAKLSDLAAAAKCKANKTSDTITLQADWSANIYGITFDANGGNGGIKGPIDVFYDSPMPALEEGWKPSRDGYAFTGWYLHLNENGNEVSRQHYDAEGGSVRDWDLERGDVLYAHWKPLSYNIEFDANFPVVEGVTGAFSGEDSVTLDYDSSFALAAPSFGAYRFAGWVVRTGEDEETSFADALLSDVVEGENGAVSGRFTPKGDLVSQADPATIQVVAKWDLPLQHAFTLYVGAPGGNELKKKSGPYDYPYAETMNIPADLEPDTVVGYEFLGWVRFENEADALAMVENGSLESATDPVFAVERLQDADLHYVAKWAVAELSVTLRHEEANEGAYVMGTDIFEYPEVEGAQSWKEACGPSEGATYKCVYNVRTDPFVLPALKREGYAFKGWKRVDENASPTEAVHEQVVVKPAEKAAVPADRALEYAPVFEEIVYAIVLNPNTDSYEDNGGYEEQRFQRRFTEEFTFPYPVALNTGSVFSCWADGKDSLSSNNSFLSDATYDLAPGKDEAGARTFGLSDLADENGTITLYGIWLPSYSVTVPLVANMAIDTETGDVVAGRTRLQTDKENIVYTVESMRYEPVKTDKGVPFEGAHEVYFSIYPGLTFENRDDAFYFLRKSKVGENGEVTYSAKDGEKTSTPLLIKLGRGDTSKLFTKTSLTNDPNEVTLDSMTTDTTGFYSFGKDKPLDIYYGIYLADKNSWKSTLQKYAFGNNQDGWELPENDAGNQSDTADGRQLGWSSDRVDIAKIRYTLSMQKTVVD